MIRSIGPIELFIVAVAIGSVIVYVVSFWRIFSKAGFPAYLSLGMLFPVVNLALCLFLAFAEWPVLRELETLRGRAAIPPPMPDRPGAV
jgi:hypothetical protein